MAKVLEKVVDTIQGLGDDKKLEIHSQAEVTRYVSRVHAHFSTPQRLRPPFPSRRRGKNVRFGYPQVPPAFFSHRRERGSRADARAPSFLSRRALD
jgi:hypothetical protein